MLWVIMRIDFMSLQTLLFLRNKWIFSLDRWRAWSRWGPWETSYRAYRRDKTASQSPPSAEERVGGNWPCLTRLCRHFSLGVVQDRECHASGNAGGLCFFVSVLLEPEARSYQEIEGGMGSAGFR